MCGPEGSQTDNQAPGLSIDFGIDNLGTEAQATRLKANFQLDLHQITDVPSQSLASSLVVALADVISHYSSDSSVKEDIEAERRDRDRRKSMVADGVFPGKRSPDHARRGRGNRHLRVR